MFLEGCIVTLILSTVGTGPYRVDHCLVKKKADRAQGASGILEDRTRV